MAERGSLRNGGHRDVAERNADDGADDEADGDEFVVDDACVEERAADGEHHAGFAGEKAAARGDGRAEPLERKNEESGGDEVGALDQRVGGEEGSHFAATRRRSTTFGPTRLEHLQHAVGDDEAADDVAGGGDDGDGAEDRGEIGFVFTGEDDGADDGDGVESVGERHQWRVKQRRDAADDFESDECGQHEDVKASEQIQLHFGVSSLAARAGNWKSSRRRALTMSPP